MTENNISACGFIGYFDGEFASLPESRFYLETVRAMFRARMLGRQCRYRENLLKRVRARKKATIKG